MAQHIIKHPRCALFVPMGMGKTSSTLLALDLLSLTEDVFPTLIVAPLYVAKHTWVEEVAKWQDFQHLSTSAIVGNAKQRKDALAQRADLYLINYENLPWLVQHLGDAWPFRTVVLDEVSRLRSFRTRQGGKRAAVFGKIAHTKVLRIIGLTGTPCSNGLLNLWGPLWFLDQGERLGRSYSAFTQRWFNLGYNGFTLTPAQGAQEAIQDRIKDLCLSINPLDYFDLQEPIETIVNIKLPIDALKVYKEMEKEWFIELEQGGVEAFNAASSGLKCGQLANGFIYKPDGSYTIIHDEKIAALKSIIEEANGMPVLVAYHFKADLKRLLEAFPTARVLDSPTIKAWNKGKVPIMLAHPASAGHGLNLQHGGNILAFYGIDWSLENYLQIIERIGPMRQLQSGYNRPTYVYYILAEGTIDMLKFKRLKTKKSVQDILLEMLKYKPPIEGIN